MNPEERPHGRSIVLRGGATQLLQIVEQLFHQADKTKISTWKNRMLPTFISSFSSLKHFSFSSVFISSFIAVNQDYFLNIIQILVSLLIPWSLQGLLRT